MTPTNTEAMAARLESGWCPIESPTDMERAATELRRLSAVEAENENLSGMAGCMDMLRRDLIEAGVIEGSVAPMFMTEAILGVLQKANGERDKFASESAQHFIRGREWAERAGQLEAERDALRADAERYRHMRGNASFRDRNGPGLYWYLPRFGSGSSAEQLDAAIDAAMKGTT